MAINLIDTGATANDGTGDPIRNAFQTVNNNFDYINGGLFAGTQSSIISAVSVDAGHVVSNTYIYASTYVNADSIVGNTVTSNGNLFVSQNGAYIVGNLTVIGNLSVSGSQAASQSQQSSSPILALHYSATPLVVNDGKDIGLEWQYYSGTEKKAFFGRQNSTGTLMYQDNITDTANVITAGTFGNVQFGSLMLSNTTAATSNVTGALQVKGGIGVQGNIYVQSNVFVGNGANIGNLTVRGYHVGSMYFSGSDTIYIGGSPVQTAAQSFNGGIVGLTTIFQDSTQSTSVSTGALRVIGGLGVSGNVFLANLSVVGNISGNIGTSSQPYITSLGQLTSITMAGQINAQNIVPEINQNYSLGTGTGTRWLKVWTYDLDSSGTLTGATITGGTVNGTNGGTFGGTLTINNTGKLVVSVGTKSTSSSTGDIVTTGGIGIGGNLYVAGSSGNAAILTGNVHIAGNILPSGITSGTSDIGAPGNAWNTIFATATSARYADLAELYKADSDYTAGTVVIFGGDEEITVTNEFADHRVAGVISTNPAYLMNSESNGLPVALRGRVPVKVTGPVNKGDLLVTSTSYGYARSVGSDTGFGVRIFAKSLETDPSNGTKIIEAVII